MRILSSALVLASAGALPQKGSASKPAAVGTSANQGAFLTIGGAYTFVSNALGLTRDLSYFVGESAFGLAWEQVPPNLQKDVADQYANVLSVIETQRLQYGIPKPAAVYAEVESEYTKKIQPLVKAALDTAYKGLEKPAELLKGFVKSFEKAYPRHAAKLPSDVFDLGLTFFVLFYFVFLTCWSCATYLFCCGMCAKRAPKLKSITQGRATNGVSGKKKNK